MAEPICADLVIRGASIATMRESGERLSAIAIANDRVLAVGSDEEIESFIGASTEVREARGASVLPGINDAHMHLSEWVFAQEPYYADISGVATLAELGARLQARASSSDEGAGFRGGPWREAWIAELADGSLAPHRSQIDEATGDHPVVLDHVSRHGLWLNSAALKLAGIDRDTPDPEGGIIVRDAAGEPTGVLLESATALAEGILPAFTREERLEAYVTGMHELNRRGITSVTDPCVSPEVLRDLIELRRRGAMTVRVNVLMHWAWPALTTSVDEFREALAFSGLATGLGDEWLRIGGIKLFADGIPSFGTAKLHEPDCDGAHGGLLTAGATEDERIQALFQLVRLAHEARLNAQIHVTGDAAADLAIAAIVEANAQDEWPDARHALIHGTLLSEGAYSRLAQTRIPVITSSIMKAGSASGMIPKLGLERWNRVFAAGSLHRAGAIVADSSDAPVADPNWLLGIATFVGAALGADPVVVESERITREQAVSGWTTAGAYLESAEQTKGFLAPGALADLVMLDRDLFAVPAEEIVALTPVLTLVGGRVTGGADAS